MLFFACVARFLFRQFSSRPSVSIWGGYLFLSNSSYTSVSFLFWGPPSPCSPLVSTSCGPPPNLTTSWSQEPPYHPLSPPLLPQRGPKLLMRLLINAGVRKPFFPNSFLLSLKLLSSPPFPFSLSSSCTARNRRCLPPSSFLAYPTCARRTASLGNRGQRSPPAPPGCRRIPWTVSHFPASLAL